MKIIIKKYGKEVSMKRWDTERLIEDADLRVIAPLIGIPTKKSGNTTYIKCLSGLHKETDINHMVADKDGCFCFTCQCSYNGRSPHNNVIDTVRQFHHTRDEDDSFDYACEEIAQYLPGGREAYIVEDDGEYRARKRLPYTTEELSSIGVSSDPVVIRTLQDLEEAGEAKPLLTDIADEAIRKLKLIYDADDYALADEAARQLTEAGKLYEKLTGKKRVDRVFRI